MIPLSSSFVIGCLQQQDAIALDLNGLFFSSSRTWGRGTFSFFPLSPRHCVEEVRLRQPFLPHENSLSTQQDVVRSSPLFCSPSSPRRAIRAVVFRWASFSFPYVRLGPAVCRLFFSFRSWAARICQGYKQFSPSDDFEFFLSPGWGQRGVPIPFPPLPILFGRAEESQGLSTWFFSLPLK